MDNKGLIIKVYDVNYDFILKNYLSPELWNRKWTLFNYKSYVVQLSLYAVYVGSRQIYFKIDVYDSKDSDKRDYDYAYYYLQTDNVNILKRKINTAVYNAIGSLENQYIRDSEEYKEIEELVELEKSKLADIANEFLDSNNVTNEDIREAYVEKYVEDNVDLDSKLSTFLYRKRYDVITDLWLCYANSVKDETRLKEIKNFSRNDVDAILKEIEEYKLEMESEKYVEDMKDKLEDI